MYFSDGIRRVDYVIAFHFSSPSNEKPCKDFLANLLQHGVDIEVRESFEGRSDYTDLLLEVNHPKRQSLSTKCFSIAEFKKGRDFLNKKDTYFCNYEF